MVDDGRAGPEQARDRLAGVEDAAAADAEHDVDVAAPRWSGTAPSTTAGEGSSVIVTSPARVTPAAARPARSASRCPDAASDRPPVTSRTRDPWAAVIAGTCANVPAPNVIRGIRPSAKAGTGERRDGLAHETPASPGTGPT